MPNTREKLIELLCEVIETDGCNGHCNFPPCYLVKACADNLIANGVTVQKWIPVTERLPGIGDEYDTGENPDPVLYMMKSTKTIYAGYYGEGGTYRDKYFRQYHDRFEGVDADDVLCWMWQNDLPEPPKGE